MRMQLSHVQINILVAAPPQCVGGNLLFRIVGVGGVGATR